MKYYVSIISPNALETLTKICGELKLPLVLATRGNGTATKSMRELLGIESADKRIVITVANEQLTAKYIKEQKKRLYIDAPGNGITIAVPIKSVGGGKTLTFLGGSVDNMKAPDINYKYELITAIANEGCTDNVMDAARAAGARGGTVIHAKGTGGANAEKFHKVSIAQEKEIVLILAKASEKAAIMTSILTNAGPGTPAGALVFSSPVTHIEGFSMNEEFGLEEEEKQEEEKQETPAEEVAEVSENQ